MSCSAKVRSTCCVSNASAPMYGKVPGEMQPWKGLSAPRKCTHIIHCFGIESKGPIVPLLFRVPRHSMICLKFEVTCSNSRVLNAATDFQMLQVSKTCGFEILPFNELAGQERHSCSSLQGLGMSMCKLCLGHSRVRQEL